MNIRPLGDRIVVEPTLETMTRMGIILPNVPGREKPSSGVVLAVGPGRGEKNTVPPSSFLSVGDTVLFGKYAGDDVKLDGKDIKILHIDSVLCCIPQKS